MTGRKFPLIFYKSWLMFLPQARPWKFHVNKNSSSSVTWKLKEKAFFFLIESLSEQIFWTNNLLLHFFYYIPITKLMNNSQSSMLESNQLIKAYFWLFSFFIFFRTSLQRHRTKEMQNQAKVTLRKKIKELIKQTSPESRSLQSQIITQKVNL